MLKEESKELQNTKELLNNIKIDVSDVKTILDQNTMEEVVEVKYSLPVVTLHFDENGEPYKNELFYALNALNLISLEDMDKIRIILEKQKIKN